MTLLLRFSLTLWHYYFVYLGLYDTITSVFSNVYLGLYDTIASVFSNVYLGLDDTDTISSVFSRFWHYSNNVYLGLLTLLLQFSLTFTLYDTITSVSYDTITSVFSNVYLGLYETINGFRTLWHYNFGFL